MADVGKGHLFGDALFNADFFQLQNTDGEEIIKYTKEGGLEIAGGGGSGGDVIKIVYDDTTMTAEDIGVAVKAVCDAGKIPAIVWAGGIYYCQIVTTEEGYFDAVFCTWGISITDSVLTVIGVDAMVLQYTEGDGWTLQDAYRDIIGV